MAESKPTPPGHTSGQQHFRTDHLIADLKERSVRGGAVTLISQGVKFSLGLTSTMCLARLLTPADFGLIAMVTAITAFATLFKDLGLSMATVRSETITHQQVSMLFWINVGISVAVMAIICALAPVVAWFYRTPSLTQITLALSVTFLFGGLTVQHQAILRRQMRFKDLAIADIMSLAVGVASAITAAVLGAGYWALVLLTVTATLTNCIMVWFLCDWRPGLPARGCEIRSLLTFGGNFTGFNVLNYFSRNADKILIGWILGPVQLGFYAKAYGLLMLPLNQINVPLANVAIPTLSRIFDDPERYRRFYFRTLNAIMWVTGPGIALLAACSTETVVLLLGKQWVEAGAVFKILAFPAFFQPIYSTIGWVFISSDRTDRMFRWAMVASPLVVLSFVIGLPYGITGVAISYAVMFVFGILSWTFAYTFKGTILTVRGLAQTLAVPALISVGVFLSAEGAGYMFREAGPLTIILASSAAALACIAVAGWLIPGVRSELVSLFRLSQPILERINLKRPTRDRQSGGEPPSPG